MSGSQGLRNIGDLCSNTRRYDCRSSNRGLMDIGIRSNLLNCQRLGMILSGMNPCICCYWGLRMSLHSLLHIDALGLMRNMVDCKLYHMYDVQAKSNKYQGRFTCKFLQC